MFEGLQNDAKVIWMSKQSFFNARNKVQVVIKWQLSFNVQGFLGLPPEWTFITPKLVSVSLSLEQKMSILRFMWGPVALKVNQLTVTDP